MCETLELDLWLERPWQAPGTSCGLERLAAVSLLIPFPFGWLHWQGTVNHDERGAIMGVRARAPSGSRCQGAKPPEAESLVALPWPIGGTTGPISKFPPIRGVGTHLSSTSQNSVSPYFDHCISIHSLYIFIEYAQCAAQNT